VIRSTDAQPDGFPATGQLRAGELAALIGIPNLWDRALERLLDRAKDERHRQGVIQRPADDIARKPIEDCDQIKPDVTLGEDPNYTHTGHAPEVLAALRNR
jgi:hypothetical protein